MSYKYNTLPSLVLFAAFCCSGCVSPPEAWVPDIAAQLEVSSDQFADDTAAIDTRQPKDGLDSKGLDVSDSAHLDLQIDDAGEDLLDAVKKVHKK